MYAVIATGGKQYRVEKGAVLRVEKLAAEPGSTVEFNERFSCNPKSEGATVLDPEPEREVVVSVPVVTAPKTWKWTTTCWPQTSSPATV